MHHPVSEINSLIHSVSLASHVSIHVISVTITILIIHHSTLSLQAQNLPFSKKVTNYNKIS